ncbi:MAG: rhomboid family intramembrane serine protease, partial [Chlamydiia bacterium]|nr:rhomboid family intramembrane serine protease [Chlamydiia bacterium]
MRRLGTIKEADKAREFSYFLQAEGIVHQVESTQEGSSFWVINEDDTIVANQWMEAFEQDPDNPMFYGHLREARRVEDLIAEEAEAQQAREFELRPERPGYPKAASTPITIGILFFCTLLFMLGQFSLSPGTNFGPMIRKTFLYDYPKQQQLFDALSEKTGIQKIKSASELSPEETDLYKEVLSTPRWRGVYPWILEKAEGKKGKSALGTPFERIRQGEVWRFVTPVFLHAGLFHIFFNMLWLIALGSQMEIRIGAFRYVAFIIVAAAVSNT